MNAFDYIHNLIKEGEHQYQDFKYAVTDTKKIARTLVAFANSDGGRLLIGVKDNGNIAGISSDEEIHMIETASILYCKPEVTYNTTIHNIGKKQVLEVSVNESKNKPHYAPDKNNKNTAYIRVNDENIAANNVISKALNIECCNSGVMMEYTDAEQKLLSFIEEKGFVSFFKAMRITKSSRNKTETILANFISIGIIEPVFENNKAIYQIKSSGNYIPE